MAKATPPTTKASSKPAKSKADESFEEGDSSLAINMAETEEATFENVPKGTYDCVVEEVEFKFSESSGQPAWYFKLTISDGEYAGRKLFYIMSFSEKALPYTKAALLRFAPKYANMPNFNPQKVADSGDLVGLAIRVRTKIEAYEGEDRTRVAAVVAPKASDDGFDS